MADKIKYAKNMFIPDGAYLSIYHFLEPHIAESELEGKSFSYKKTIYYLDDTHEKVVRISPKSWLRKRKIELTDKIDSEIINGIRIIIENKRNLVNKE
jgi:hypothetical protein